jgi:rSAM/selenodomain-associated transferase 1
MTVDASFLYPQARILLFARAPYKGKVKTRLIPVLGDQGALDLHMRLLKRQISILAESRLCPSQLWIDQQSLDPLVESFIGDTHLQRGDELGERMFYAAKQVLDQALAVIIIGSDCPELDESYLEEALQYLFKPDTDVVIGPALDGGYVLIGMKKAEWHIFSNIDWGSDKVLEQTRDRLNSLKLSCRYLDPLCDIDTEEDLARLL